MKRAKRVEHAKQWTCRQLRSQADKYRDMTVPPIVGTMAQSTTAASLLGRIQAVLPSLSANDRKVAKHLLSTFPRGAWETVEKVAAEVSVSKAAVIRFAARLGYEGFAELQRDLQAEVSEQFASPLSLLQRMVPASGHDAFERLKDATVRNLAAAANQSSTAIVVALAGRIAACTGKVYVIGSSKSFAAANYAHYMLNLLLPNIILVPPEVSSLPNALIDVGAEDIILAVSVTRYSKATISALMHCRARRAHIAVITDSHLGPAARSAKSLIVAPNESPSPFESSIMAIFYLELLVSLIATECRESAEKRLEMAVRLGREFGTFEDSGQSSPSLA